MVKVGSILVVEVNEGEEILEIEMDYDFQVSSFMEYINDGYSIAEAVEEYSWVNYGLFETSFSVKFLEIK